MDMIEYLKQNFPNVDANSVQAITVDGVVRGYYAKEVGNRADEIYIPANVATGGNVGMLSYIPGAGGSTNDAKGIRDRIFNNPPDYVVSISYSPGDPNACIEKGYNLAKGANLTVTDNVTVCFSLSGAVGVTQTEDFLENHPDVHTTVISCNGVDGKIQKHLVNGKDDLSALIQSKSPIIFVDPVGSNAKERIQALRAKGINAYWLQTNYASDVSSDWGTQHITINKDILSNGIVDYILGYADNFSFDSVNSSSPFLKYALN